MRFDNRKSTVHFKQKKKLAGSLQVSTEVKKKVPVVTNKTQ
jgi:hypothetical protein